MDANDNLDKLFKDKLGDSQAAVPTGSWQSIAQKVAIQKENKSKGFVLPFPFFWIAASFLAGSFAGISSNYIYNLRKENESLKEFIIQNENNRVLLRSQITNKSASGENYELTRKYSFNMNGELPNKLKNAHPLIVPVHYRYKNSENLTGRKSVRNTSTHHSQNKEVIYLSPEKVSAGNISGGNLTLFDKEKRAPILLSGKSPLIQKQGKPDSIITKTDTIYIAKKVGEIEQDKKIKKAVRIMGFPISVGLYVSPEMASRTMNFSENTDPEIVKYKQKDERKFGLSAGLSLDIHLPKNFFIRTGISYWNVGEKNNVLLKHSDYDTTYTKSQSTSYDTKITKTLPTVNGGLNTVTPYPDTSIRIPVNNGGNYIMANKSTIETNSRNIKESVSQFSSTISNNYHYIGIPVIAGMKLNNKKLSFGIFSGVITNVLVSSSQSIYYIYYNPEQPDKYVEAKRELARFSLVYTGGVDLDYRIAKLWTVSLSPNIKYSLTSIYKNDNSVKQLPYSFGLQVGVRYRIGN